MNRQDLFSGIFLALCVLFVSGCADSRDDERVAWLLTKPAESSPAIERVAESLGDYLNEMTGHAGSVVTRSRDAETSLSGDLVIHLAHGRVDLGDDSFAIDIDERPAQTIISLSADNDRGHQYAVYEFLRQLGVRFYHPEQEFVPQLTANQVQRRARTRTVLSQDRLYRPDFKYRSFTFHSAHPLEHLEAFSDGRHPIAEAERVNDWILKNRGNQFRGAGRGVAPIDDRVRRGEELEVLRRQLDMTRATGITLHQQQQGFGSDIPLDEDDPKSVIESQVRSRLESAPDATFFGIHFGPTELTVTPDRPTIDWINWAGRAARSIEPDITVFINNHTTGSQPTENFDDLGCPSGTNPDGKSDYYDLAFHADPELGVQVHTVMFYPLEGPAPVYEQISFAHKLCLMQRASDEGRPLLFFPEGSWWLSFDNAVPVYLPLYIYGRGRDFELISPLLASRGSGTLVGHKMFNSGHEWGYWQQDYAVGLWHWNSSISQRDVFGELFDPLCDPDVFPDSCAARDAAIQVMEALIEEQVELFLNRPDHRGVKGGIYFYFAGEDPADEIAAASGLGFRPIRVSFREVAEWDENARDHFRATDLRALRETEDQHGEWLTELEAYRAQVPEPGLVWFDEFVDGLRINQLRARHTRLLYESALQGERSEELDQVLQEVESVIRARESSYRYPSEQMFGGGITPETAVENGTTYPFRVHTKTHLLTYWTYREAQLDAVLSPAAAVDGLRLTPVFGDSDTHVEVTWPEMSEWELTISGERVPPLDPSFTPGEGISSMTAVHLPSSGPETMSGFIVRGGSQKTSAALTIMEPANPAIGSILTPLLPPLIFALDDTQLAVSPVGSPTEFTDVDASRFYLDSERIVAEDMTLTFDLAGDRAEAPVLVQVTSISVRTNSDTGFGDRLELNGMLALADIVQALVDLAGFDERGALMTLSGFLGFDSDAPPEFIPLSLEVTLAD